MTTTDEESERNAADRSSSQVAEGKQLIPVPRVAFVCVFLLRLSDLGRRLHVLQHLRNGRVAKNLLDLGI